MFFLKTALCILYSLVLVSRKHVDAQCADDVPGLRLHQKIYFAVNRCSANITKKEVAAMVSILPQDCSFCRSIPYAEELHILERQLQCSRMTEKYEINFFAAPLGKTYEMLVPFYAFFALSSNINAIVEIVVQNRTAYILEYARALKWLLNEHGQSLCIRNFQAPIETLPHLTRNTARFFEVPVVSSKYTYIGDTDILMFESAVYDSRRLQQMAFYNLPYSNVVRHGTKRLTGLMFVDTEKYYSEAFKKMIKNFTNPEYKLWIGNDEAILYSMVEGVHGLPSTVKDASNSLMGYRPSHGLHLSPNRLHNKNLGISSNIHEWCRILSARSIADFSCSHPAGCTVLASYANSAGLWNNSVDTDVATLMKRAPMPEATGKKKTGYFGIWYSARTHFLG